MSSHLAENFRTVREEVSTAAQDCGREAQSVKLVAVSKTHGPEAVQEIIALGQTHFGENRVQEAEAKWPELKNKFPDVKLHLIGPLQRNKAALAIRLFDVIETVDRVKLAASLARHMNETGLRPDCLIQVNTGEEPQKAGVLPKEVDSFIAQCRDEFNLPIVGLMCIPPVDEEPALHFALLREMAERNELHELSMGMSADYTTAIQFGATFIRVGTAIFGPRSNYWDV